MAGTEPVVPLSDQQNESLTAMKNKLRVRNEQYLRQHPELRGMMTLYVSTCLEQRPENPLHFAARFFRADNLKQAVLDNQVLHLPDPVPRAVSTHEAAEYDIPGENGDGDGNGDDSDDDVLPTMMRGQATGHANAGGAGADNTLLRVKQVDDVSALHSPGSMAAMKIRPGDPIESQLTANTGDASPLADDTADAVMLDAVDEAMRPQGYAGPGQDPILQLAYVTDTRNAVGRAVGQRSAAYMSQMVAGMRDGSIDTAPRRATVDTATPTLFLHGGSALVAGPTPDQLLSTLVLAGVDIFALSAEDIMAAGDAASLQNVMAAHATETTFVSTNVSWDGTAGWGSKISDDELLQARNDGTFVTRDTRYPGIRALLGANIISDGLVRYLPLLVHDKLVFITSTIDPTSMPLILRNAAGVTDVEEVYDSALADAWQHFLTAIGGPDRLMEICTFAQLIVMARLKEDLCSMLYNDLQEMSDDLPEGDLRYFFGSNVLILAGGASGGYRVAGAAVLHPGTNWGAAAIAHIYQDMDDDEEEEEEDSNGGGDDASAKQKNHSSGLERRVRDLSNPTGNYHVTILPLHPGHAARVDTDKMHGVIDAIARGIDSIWQANNAADTDVLGIDEVHASLMMQDDVCGNVRQACKAAIGDIRKHLPVAKLAVHPASLNDAMQHADAVLLHQGWMHEADVQGHGTVSKAVLLRYLRGNIDTLAWRQRVHVLANILQSRDFIPIEVAQRMLGVATGRPFGRHSQADQLEASDWRGPFGTGPAEKLHLLRFFTDVAETGVITVHEALQRTSVRGCVTSRLGSAFYTVAAATAALDDSLLLRQPDAISAAWDTVVARSASRVENDGDMAGLWYGDGLPTGVWTRSTPLGFLVASAIACLREEDVSPADDDHLPAFGFATADELTLALPAGAWRGRDIAALMQRIGSARFAVTLPTADAVRFVSSALAASHSRAALAKSTDNVPSSATWPLLAGLGIVMNVDDASRSFLFKLPAGTNNSALSFEAACAAKITSETVRLVATDTTLAHPALATDALPSRDTWTALAVASPAEAVLQLLQQQGDGPLVIEQWAKPAVWFSAGADDAPPSDSDAAALSYLYEAPLFLGSA